VRTILSNDKVRPRVHALLLPHERPVIIARLHRAMIIPRLVTATGGLLAAVVIGPVVQGNRVLELAIWLLVIVLMAQLVLAVLDWLSRYLVITSSRLFMICGIFGPSMAFSSPVALMRDVRLTRSIGGRLSGYGTLVLESEHLAIDYVPYPEQIYLELLGVSFGEESHEDEESHVDENSHGDD
jgi:hypothetical protein